MLSVIKRPQTSQGIKGLGRITGRGRPAARQSKVFHHSKYMNALSDNFRMPEHACMEASNRGRALRAAYRDLQVHLERTMIIPCWNPTTVLHNTEIWL